MAARIAIYLFCKNPLPAATSAEAAAMMAMTLNSIAEVAKAFFFVGCASLTSIFIV